LKLSRELDVTHNTAWQLKHKVVQIMLQRNEAKRLLGRIEIDDADIGGERPGAFGRGAASKTAFVAVVQTSDDGRPQQAQLRRVSGFTQTASKDYAQASIVPASHTVSDSLSCFRVFDQPNYSHDAIVIGGGRSGVDNLAFNWVNTVLGNIKNAMTGTMHAIGGIHVPAIWAGSNTASIADSTCRR
jgi:hypothetical protein